MNRSDSGVGARGVGHSVCQDALGACAMELLQQSVFHGHVDMGSE